MLLSSLLFTTSFRNIVRGRCKCSEQGRGPFFFVLRSAGPFPLKNRLSETNILELLLACHRKKINFFSLLIVVERSFFSNFDDTIMERTPDRRRLYKLYSRGEILLADERSFGRSVGGEKFFSSIQNVKYVSRAFKSQYAHSIAKGISCCLQTTVCIFQSFSSS